jgi:hypothetical protein
MSEMEVNPRGLATNEELRKMIASIKQQVLPLQGDLAPKVREAHVIKIRRDLDTLASRLESESQIIDAP